MLFRSLPVTTYSAHWIADPRLRAAVARYLEAERAEVSVTIEVLSGYGPYKHLAPDEQD